MYKILIVEDEVIAAEYLKNILEKEGWVVLDIVDNEIDIINNIKKNEPDLVLMDIMINGVKSGCEVAIDVRKISNCAIVFATAYANQEMINYAIDIKAEGYIVKPYNEKEIKATISLLSSKKQSANHNNFRISKIIGGFYFDHEINLLYKDKHIVKLGSKSLKLIQILSTNRGNIVSYQTLYSNIWNDEINLKKLQMVVYRIREICNYNFIKNINGIGYRIRTERPVLTKPEIYSGI